jgi:DNA-binding LacI/PurR family transcriptional regulator
VLPVVSIGDGLRGGHAHGEVVFDNRRGVTLALEHLHGLGHRHVAVLTPTRASTPDRPADVYVNAEAARLGLDVSVVPSHQTLPAATEVAREVLSRRPRPTAVFCFTDSIAYGVYAATRELGLAVPGDVSVTGYDDHPMSALLTPPLTSVDWDIEGIVHAAVRVVVGAIDGKARKRRVVCEPSLRRRESTNAPPAPTGLTDPVSRGRPGSASPWPRRRGPSFRPTPACSCRAGSAWSAWPTRR